jgi:chromosome segregation ATPase
MAMENVLQQLEAKIDDFVAAHSEATARVAELEKKVAELEEQLEASGAADERVAELEKQRDHMAERLEKVLQHIDKALESSDVDDA